MSEERQGALPRVGLVATDEVRVAGLEAVLEAGVGCDLVRLSAPQMLRSQALEVVLIDAAATDHLLELIASFRRFRPQIRVIVLGPDRDLAGLERVIGAGAKGYVSYSAAAAEVRMAVDVVRDGSVWAPRKVLSRLLERATSTGSAAAQGPVRITQREGEVLKLLCEGQPNKAMAGQLGVEESTVKAHLGRLMRKAGVNNRTALGMRALELGWLPPNDVT